MLAVSDPARKSLMTSNQLEIAIICDEIKNMLLKKNAKYGDSALNPSRVFSKASPIEQLLVRIDDKLSRIQRGVGLLASDEDVVNDLIGYLVLLRIALKTQDRNRSSIADRFYVPSGSQDIISFGGLPGGDTNEPWDGADINPDYEFYFESYKKGGVD